MKRIFIALAVVMMAYSVSAKTPLKEISTPASDSRITFVGRTLTEDNKVSFDWSGVYAKVTFKGNYLAMKASDTKKNYFNIWLDKDMSQERLKVINTSKTDSLIVLVSEEDIKAMYPKDKKAQNGEHTVILQKRTEGEQGRATISEFITRGEILQAEGIKPRIIEFVGDSYTCGYGTEGKDQYERFAPHTENCNYSYAPIVSRFFDAEYILVSHSGMGIARNYNDNKKGTHMPDLYLRTFDEDESVVWNAKDSQMKADVTVVYLCTNDFSTGRQPTIDAFVKNYTRLIRSIKDNYGEDHPVLCVAGKSDELMPYYIHAAAERCGMKNVHYMFLSPSVHGTDGELGSDWHPNYVAHTKKAFSIIPYISTLTGWEIEKKAVK